MATIQVRDLPEDVAEELRHRAEASGRSLQSYMRDQLIEMARRRDKAQMIELVERALANNRAAGLSRETIDESLSDLRGE